MKTSNKFNYAIFLLAAFWLFVICILEDTKQYFLECLSEGKGLEIMLCVWFFVLASICFGNLTSRNEQEREAKRAK